MDNRKVLNVFGLFVVCGILIYALSDQLRYSDLPCPLCWLQRICFILVGLSFCANLSRDRPQNYSFAALASVLGGLIALRQMLLHIMPNDPGYGRELLGMHFYSWAMVVFVCFLLLICLTLQFDQVNKKGPKSIQLICKIFLWLFAFLIIVNMLAAFFECGLGQCPDNPVSYLLFEK